MIPFAYRTITVFGLPFQGCSAREILILSLLLSYRTAQTLSLHLFSNGCNLGTKKVLATPRSLAATRGIFAKLCLILYPAEVAIEDRASSGISRLKSLRLVFFSFGY